MAKKPTIKYACSNCGAIYGAWAGRCNSCGEWNTLTEQLDIKSSIASSSAHSLETTSLARASAAKESQRLTTGIDDVNNVLGGGIVPGSLCLVAGQPGIGKSTLLLQVAHNVSVSHKVLYISGEESSHQVGLRAARLGATSDTLELATSTSANDIAATLSANHYDLVVIDSVQTLSCSEISSAAGSVTQITNSTQLITAAAKQVNTAVLLVGHVTKEGSIAGPKVLEHIVDVVLQLEGDRYGGFKVLRTVKNRFGPTSEVGIFEMEDGGLRQVDNPSAALLAERHVTDGSVVLATMEGTRPILVEVQALVNKTAYGYPKRASVGFELNRLNLLIAMLERRTKLNFADLDVYINIVGGMKITEPAADLAICLALGSAAKGLQLKQNAVVFGEVGLSGEVRHVPYIEKRLAEAKKLGFEIAIAPKSPNGKKTPGLTVVSDVRSALNTFLKV